MKFPTLLALLTLGATQWTNAEVPPLPDKATLELDEDWSSGEIDPARWYPLRKKWGKGNHGVVPENVTLTTDTVSGSEKTVLSCTARGDHYTGPVSGEWGKHTRVGGVLVSRQHFASGRFQVVMKIGTPQNPAPPGIVPAIWTYGYKAVSVPPDLADGFTETAPLYHPRLQQWGKGKAFYWSEIDFPEFGKAGGYNTPMYNTFLNKQHHSLEFDARGAADGRYHTYTTDWHTGLAPVPGITDTQVTAALGFYWINDASVPFADYHYGSPLKKLGTDRYAVCVGTSAKHYIDGRLIGENTTFVPSMTGQLNIGVWLPHWAGPAPWQSVDVRFASVKVWQFHDPGDARGILTENITDSFAPGGSPLSR